MSHDCSPNWVLKKRARLAYKLAEAINAGECIELTAKKILEEFDVEHEVLTRERSIKEVS